MQLAIEFLFGYFILFHQVPVGFVVGEVPPFVMQRILQLTCEKDGFVGIIILEYAQGDGRLFGAWVPVAFIRVVDVPKPVLSEADAGTFFYDGIGGADIVCHDPNMLRVFREDHAAREHFEGQSVAILIEDAPDHGAKTVAPTAIRIITIVDSHS